MNDFTASNGVRIWEARRSPGALDFIDGEDGARLPEWTVAALREFFQAEADERLGRWRWPENPDYVVYPKPDEAFERMFGPGLDLVILRESDGMTKGYVREEDQGGRPMAHRVDHMLAARAYFDAHPEPKPWHEAKPGEVWLLTTNMPEEPYLVNGRGSFDGLYASHERDDAAIESGRRIYPEVSS